VLMDRHMRHLTLLGLTLVWEGKGIRYFHLSNDSAGSQETTYEIVCRFWEAVCHSWMIATGIHPAASVVMLDR